MTAESLLFVPAMSINFLSLHTDQENQEIALDAIGVHLSGRPPNFPYRQGRFPVKGNASLPLLPYAWRAGVDGPATRPRTPVPVVDATVGMPAFQPIPPLPGVTVTVGHLVAAEYPPHVAPVPWCVRW